MIDTVVSASVGAQVPVSERLVVDGLNMVGSLNTSHEDIYANLRYAIQQGHPQVWNQQPNGEQVCIVAGGNSLNDTEQELVDLWHAGAKVVTVNGSYQWCLKRHIKPHAQVIVDARASSLHFIEPARPDVRYLLASQCHPSLWDAVKDRPLVGIWHALDKDDPGAAILADYYCGSWQSIVGGTTVGTRAIGLCRALGFLRMHLFGMDACYLGGHGHAYAQPENDADQRIKVTFQAVADPSDVRIFEVAPWHLKHLEDTLRFIKHAGKYFALSVHGDGLLAYALHHHATMAVPKE
jgi:hypothetical protein